MQDQVGRSEVVRPLTGAVDFVHADHRNLATKLAEIFHEEALWCDEEDFDLPLLHCFDDVLLCAELLLGVESGSGDEVWQLLQLIRHERYQRSHHEDQARQESACILIA